MGIPLVSSVVEFVCLAVEIDLGIIVVRPNSEIDGIIILI